MKFLHLFNKSPSGFTKIQGYEEIKDIVRRTLDADENYNLLFVGPPASSKTLFLLGIIEMKSGVYFDGNNTTNRILDVLQERRPKNLIKPERRTAEELQRIVNIILQVVADWRERGAAGILRRTKRLWS